MEFTIQSNEKYEKSLGTISLKLKLKLAKFFKKIQTKLSCLACLNQPVLY